MSVAKCFVPVKSLARLDSSFTGDVGAERFESVIQHVRESTSWNGLVEPVYPNDFKKIRYCSVSQPIVSVYLKMIEVHTQNFYGHHQIKYEGGDGRS